MLAAQAPMHAWTEALYRRIALRLILYMFLPMSELEILSICPPDKHNVTDLALRKLRPNAGRQSGKDWQSFNMPIGLSPSAK